MWHFSGGYGVWMVIFWVIVIGLIIWAVTSYTSGRGPETGSKKDALDIARERYAKGEISKEQFEQIKKDLM